ncbi:bifunctional metallophosphatase/5'-nucleotidase [Mycoplasma phocoeninasale]|uniref:Bifunctional metallophosphatase/5'-nucleotidase n=1 Tax=Mycoplasma phocoeninasale TaxID=2726117 RepID=A0A858U4N5_9MOLU|nr:bifunctional UDP-sugar hydrolase/5'-nucleotidase [Mycoplasma phocoeninasale]QJG66193.1 bifunctional metallophosphatase/5'-nucleotidase [Mycoplasma phocoeninasale]
MKRKFLRMTSIAFAAAASLPVLALTAISCVKKAETKTHNEAEIAKVRNEYKQTKDQYNQLLDNLAKEYKATMADMEKVSKGTEEQTIKTQKLAALKAKIFNINDVARKKLNPLLKLQNYLFESLKRLEKTSDIKTVKIFHTNDEHGRLEYDAGRFNNFSGMERTSKYIKDKNYDLLISAGDLIQGLPLSDVDKGETITKIAKYVGYDSIAIGNHEFDYGLDHILKLNQLAEKEENGWSMPFISANIYWRDYANETGKPDGYDQSRVNKRVFKPYIIKTLENNVKVAIMGLTTPDTRYTSHPRNSVLVDFRDPATSARETIAEIKKDHPDVNFIIASTHLGVGRNNREWTSEYLAENVKDIDLILDGHSHTYVQIHRNAEDEAYITQTEAYTKYLGDIELEFNTKTGKIVAVTQQLRDINQITVATNDSSDLFISELKKHFDKEYSVKVFNNTLPFEHTTSVEVDGTPYWKGRIQATELGVLVSDSLAWEFVANKPWEQNTEITNKDPGTLDNVIGLTNGGGIRTDLPVGDVLRKDLLALSPFGNRISAVQLKGDNLLKVFEHAISKGRSGGYGQWSFNVSYQAKTTKQKSPRSNKDEYIWSLVKDSVKINGKAIDPNKYYYVVTNDFLVVGGDGYTALNPAAPENSNVKLVYEGGKYIDTLEKYLIMISNPSFMETNGNTFAKPLAKYGKDIIKNQTLDIPKDAFTNMLKEPDNSKQK